MAEDLRMASTHKVHREHLERLAVVYVRQSTVHQVQQHSESTKLQYGLVEQATRMGWPKEQIVVIDEDLGVSGASAEGRYGFQRLLSEVALNHVGLILGVEMSRLARSCKDWYQLLELCALFRTLISDLDGLYDPANYNDRLLLGLKGTMSEAELHVLKQRMLQGALQKARRGELVSKVPIGYVRNAAGDVQLDPDEEAQSVVRMIFDQFERLGSASRTLRWMVENQVRLPVRQDSGPEKGMLAWRRPSISTVRNLLTHPMYSGAYVYGRTCQNPTTRRIRNVSQRLPRDEWQVLLKDRYPAYISWEQFEQNVAQLVDNRPSRRGTVREGRALLAGVITCGRCGCRMTTRYRGKASQPRYHCDVGRATYGQERCQCVAARAIDQEVVRLTLHALAPSSLDVSLQVATDIERNRLQLDAHWQNRIERARYEADRAQRQFDAVEPENRLVARTLERAWEAKLSDFEQLEREYARFKLEQPQQLTEAERKEISDLSEKLPRLWNAEGTTDADRKEILRQVIEKVTVNVEGESEWVEVHVHWLGGQQTYSRIRRPIAGSTRLSRWPEMIQRLKILKDEGLSSREIAARLNEEGFKPAKGATITAEMVRTWSSRHGLTKSRRDQDVTLGPNEWTIPSIVERYQLSHGTIHGWIQRGQLAARQTGGRRGRWIIQADEQQLDQLVNNRRTRKKRKTPKIRNRVGGSTVTKTSR